MVVYSWNLHPKLSRRGPRPPKGYRYPWIIYYIAMKSIWNMSYLDWHVLKWYCRNHITWKILVASRTVLNQALKLELNCRGPLGHYITRSRGVGESIFVKFLDFKDFSHLSKSGWDFYVADWISFIASTWIWLLKSVK